MLTNSRKRAILTKLGSKSKTVTEGAKAVAEGVKSTFTGAKAGASEGVKTVGEGAKKMWEGAREAADPAMKAVGETFTGARITKAKGARQAAQDTLKGLTETKGFRASMVPTMGKATDAEWKAWLKTSEGKAALEKWKATSGGKEVLEAQSAAAKAGRKVWGERGITAGAYTGAAGAVAVPSYYTGKSRGKKSRA